MECFARFSEDEYEMSGRPRHLRLITGPPLEASLQEAPAPATEGVVALIHEWRAAQIARSRAMHPTRLANALAPPDLRPVR
jgi:hypothetical protein